MNTANLLTWFIRFGHVAGGAIWLGGYLLLAFVIIPALTKGRNEALERLSHLSVRVLTYAGTATIVFGLLLVARTRGYGNLFTGEWGAIIITCTVIALALLGIGDGGLRPALRRLPETGNATPARRLALIGFVLTVLAVAFMTWALYAVS